MLLLLLFLRKFLCSSYVAGRFRVFHKRICYKFMFFIVLSVCGRNCKCVGVSLCYFYVVHCVSYILNMGEKPERQYTVVNWTIYGRFKLLKHNVNNGKQSLYILHNYYSINLKVCIYSFLVGLLGCCCCCCYCYFVTLFSFQWKA